MKMPKFDMAAARIIAGAGAFALTVMVFAIIVWRPELADNTLFGTLAQAVVIQGLIGLVMAFMFTGTQGKPPNDPSA